MKYAVAISKTLNILYMVTKKVLVPEVVKAPFYDWR